MLPDLLLDQPAGTRKASPETLRFRGHHSSIAAYPSLLATRSWHVSFPRLREWSRERHPHPGSTHWEALGCCYWTHPRSPRRTCQSSSQRFSPFPSFLCALPFSCDVSFSCSSLAHGPRCRWCGGLRKVHKSPVISNHSLRCTEIAQDPQVRKKCLWIQHYHSIFDK